MRRAKKKHRIFPLFCGLRSMSSTHTRSRRCLSSSFAVRVIAALWLRLLLKTHRTDHIWACVCAYGERWLCFYLPHRCAERCACRIRVYVYVRYACTCIVCVCASANHGFCAPYRSAQPAAHAFNFSWVQTVAEARMPIRSQPRVCILQSTKQITARSVCILSEPSVHWSFVVATSARNKTPVNLCLPVVY